MRIALSLLAIVLTIFLVSASTGEVEIEKIPLSGNYKVLMCGDGRNYPEYPWALYDTSQWAYVSDNVDIVKIYIGDLTSEPDPEEVRRFVEALKEKDIKIALEIGGLVDWHADKFDQSANYSFQEEYGQVKPYLDMFEADEAINFIDIIELDCPVRRMLFPFDERMDYHNRETAIRELIKVIGMWQEVLPEADINLITNFPNWGWRGSVAYRTIDGSAEGYGQYDLVLEEIIRQLYNAEMEINALTIDYPFEYAMSMAVSNQPELISSINWISYILELENMAKSYGLEVNIIFNSELGGRSSNSLFAQHSLAYLNLYLSYGGNPDGFWLQSWYKYPDQWLPEDSDFTMTNLTGDVIKRLEEYYQD